jgi:hypothetical protein
MRVLLNKVTSWFKPTKTRIEYSSFDEDYKYQEAIERYHSLMFDISLTELERKVLSCLRNKATNSDFSVLQTYNVLRDDNYSCADIKEAFDSLLLKNLVGKKKKRSKHSLFNRYYLIL